MKEFIRSGIVFNILCFVTSLYAQEATSLISKQPITIEACANAKVSFDLVANADEYQWEFSKDHGTTWVNITDVYGTKGAQSSHLSYVHINEKFDHGKFRCKVKKGVLEEISNEVEFHLLKPLELNVVGNTPVCLGEELTLEAQGAEKYSWDHDVINGHAFKPSVAGLYTVKGTNANGCKGKAEVEVVINALPDVDAGEDKKVCLGDEVLLTASGANSFEWNHGGVNNESIKITKADIFTVTGTNEKGCKAKDQVRVDIYAVPHLDLGPDQDICIGNDVHLKAHSVDVSHFDWDHDLGHGHGHTVKPTETTTYVVSVHSRDNCLSSDSVTVNVHELPVVDAGADQTICAGDDITLKAIGAEVYHWDSHLGKGDVHVVRPHAHMHNPLNIHQHATSVYKVLGIDEYGCRNEDEVTIHINALPKVHAGHSQHVCADEFVALEPSGAVEYSWDHNVESYSFFPAEVTTTYRVTGTDENGCSHFADVTIFVYNKHKCHELNREKPSYMIDVP